MSGRDLIEPLAAVVPPMQNAGVIVGELVALDPDGSAPLVVHGAIVAAVRARTVVDLQAAHLGRQVVLMLEEGDPSRPIVMGLLQAPTGWPNGSVPPLVEVIADDRRLVLNARDQLVLRCGRASITLTRAGKVLVEGTYVSSRSTGVNRLRGGSVQLN